MYVYKMDRRSQVVHRKIYRLDPYDLFADPGAVFQGTHVRVTLIVAGWRFEYLS